MMKSIISRASVFALALDVCIIALFIAFIVPVVSINKTSIIICTIISLIAGTFLHSFLSHLFSKKLSGDIKCLKSDAFKLSNKTISKLNIQSSNESIKSIVKHFNVHLENQKLDIVHYKELLNMYRLIFDKLEQGVILLNLNKEIVLYNTNADKLLSDGLSINSNIKYSNIFHTHILSMYDTVHKSNKPLAKTINLPKSGKTVEVYMSTLSHNLPDKVDYIIVLLTDNTELDKLRKVRDEFAANVTHELKTPLTSIMGYIELLNNEERDIQTRKYFYDIIYSEAQKLFTLIDDMLLLAQVENMKDSAVPQKCNVKDVVYETVQRLMPLAEKRNISIEVNIEPSLNVGMSSIRMYQLFSNIIGNAIKYNIENGKIFINAFRERNDVTISVKDTGLGIRDEHLDKIFERFFRSDKMRASGIPGTGLGLAIVKDIVKLYNGDIQVKSELNKGSEFIITFPLFNR